MKKKLLTGLFALLTVGMCNEVCAEALLPFGQMSNEVWSGKFFYALNNSGETPADNWYAEDFDESGLNSIKGPISNSSSYYYNTQWSANYSTYWVRRHFTIDSLATDNLYLMYFIHDDGCKAYLNGNLVYDNGNVAGSYNTVILTAEMISSLKEGDNVLSVMVSDTGGGEAFMDFGLYSYETTDFILGKTDVPLTIVENDSWIPDASNGCLTNGNKGTRYSTSVISFAYQSDYKTELKLDWASYYYSNHPGLSLYVDGVLKSTTTNSSYTTPRIYVDAGEHIITVRDSIGNSTSSSNWSRIKNLIIREIKPLETVVLSENSANLTFENNGAYPWTIEDGYIQNSNYGTSYSSSSFSTTFSIDKLCKFSLDQWVNRYDEYTSNASAYHTLRM